MTVSIKVHVNGNYRATCLREGDKEPVIVGPQEEKSLPHTHGQPNVYTVTEEYLGEKPA